MMDIWHKQPQIRLLFSMISVLLLTTQIWYYYYRILEENCEGGKSFSAIYADD